MLKNMLYLPQPMSCIFSPLKYVTYIQVEGSHSLPIGWCLERAVTRWRTESSNTDAPKPTDRQRSSHRRMTMRNHEAEEAAENTTSQDDRDLHNVAPTSTMQHQQEQYRSAQEIDTGEPENDKEDIALSSINFQLYFGYAHC